MASRYAQLLAQARASVGELMPWELQERLTREPDLLLLDVREPAEFAAAHIARSLNVPRGVLEQACEWDHDETEPQLVQGRDRPLVVVCRSGNRSLLAAQTLQTLGFAAVASLRLGVRGWNEAELPLVDGNGALVDPDEAERRLAARLRAEQRRPRGEPGGPSESR